MRKSQLLCELYGALGGLYCRVPAVNLVSSDRRAYRRGRGLAG